MAKKRKAITSLNIFEGSKGMQIWTLGCRDVFGGQCT